MTMNRDWLRAKLEVKKLNQTKFSELVGIRNAAISELYSGHRQLTLPEAARFSKILDCTLQEVYLASIGENPESKKALNYDILQFIISVFLDALSVRLKAVIPSDEFATLIVDTYKEAEGSNVLNDNELKSELKGNIYGQVKVKSF